MSHAGSAVSRAETQGSALQCTWRTLTHAHGARAHHVSVEQREQCGAWRVARTTHLKACIVTLHPAHVTAALRRARVAGRHANFLASCLEEQAASGRRRAVVHSQRRVGVTKCLLCLHTFVSTHQTRATSHTDVYIERVALSRRPVHPPVHPCVRFAARARAASAAAVTGLHTPCGRDGSARQLDSRCGALGPQPGTHPRRRGSGPHGQGGPRGAP